jgi:hypothetical protein
MSQENVSNLRRLIDAFNHRDTETALSILHPEIEFHSALVERKTYRGLQGMAQYREDLAPSGRTGIQKTIDSSLPGTTSSISTASSAPAREAASGLLRRSR